MILMSVREGDNVEFLKAARPQIRRNRLLSWIDPAAALPREPAERAASVDQHRLPSRRNDEKRISLSDIQDAHLQLSRRPCWSKRKKCDKQRARRQASAQPRRNSSAPRVSASQSCRQQEREGEECNYDPEPRSGNPVAPFRQVGEPMHDVQKR